MVVDDNPDELRQLVNALHSMGAPCLGILYDQVTGMTESHLRGARLLFMDLHLTTGAQTTNVSGAAAVIVQLLRAGITRDSGPYVIILWTTHEQQKAEFTAYVMEHLPVDQRPIAITSLDKNRYRTPDAGPKLIADVTAIVDADPRLRAILHWERDVLKAAGETLAQVARLVPEADRTSAQYSGKLDEILSVLAVGAIGKANASDDPRSAVNAALIPILADRIAHQRAEPNSTVIWKEALTRLNDAPEPSPENAARLNVMLNVALPDTEVMSAGSWGAVTIIPDADLTPEAMAKRFDLTAAGLPSALFCLAEKADRKLTQLCVVRIGASCDHAQSKRGPVPFVLGAVVPAGAAFRAQPKGNFVSPAFNMPGFEGQVRFVFCTRIQVSLVPSDFAGWLPLCRLREQLLMQVIAQTANHATRPAIVSFGA